MTDDTAAPNPEQSDEDLDHRIGKLNERLDSIEVRLEDAETESARHYRAVLDELKSDRAKAVAAVKAVGEATGDAWETVADETRRAFERLEGAVETTWADLEADLADNVETYREAVAHQLESWKARLDELRVQAKLAEMEARDAMGELEIAFEAARPELERARAAADDTWHTVKEGVSSLVAHLRDAARSAGERMD